MKKALMFLAICGIVMAMSASAFASVLPMGEPFITNSWVQAFNESGVGTFNQTALWSLTGAGFEAPAFRSFSSGVWTNYDPSISNAYAFGPNVSSENFNIVFNGASSSPLSFLFMASQGTIVKEWAYAAWSGSSWSIRAATSGEIGDKRPLPGNPVPEPATMLLLGMGALGLFGLRKRKAA